MRYFVITFFLTILLRNTSIAQSNVTETALHYIDLLAPEHEGLYRNHNEIVRIIFNAAKSKQLKPYLVQFPDLNAEEIDSAMVNEILFPFDYRNHVFPTDVRYISMDINKTRSGRKSHYINLYVERNEELKYLFSVSWSALVKLIHDQYPHFLFTVNPWGEWFRGNILNAMDRYFVARETGLDFILLHQQCNKLPFFNQDASPYDVSHFHSLKKSVHPFDCVMEETKNNDSYKIQKLKIFAFENNRNSSNDSCFYFHWSDFLKIAEDSSWNNYPPLKTWEEAFRNYEFVFSSKYLPKKIESKAKEFKEELPSSKEYDKNKLVIFQEEGLYLRKERNRVYSKLIPLIMEYVNTNKIQAHDSPYSFPQKDFLKNCMNKRVTGMRYLNEEGFNIGDTVCVGREFYVAKVKIPGIRLVPVKIGVQTEDGTLLEESASEYEKRLPDGSWTSDFGPDDLDYPELTGNLSEKRWTKIPPPKHTIAEIEDLELTSRVEFDSLGLNKKYFPDKITLYISPEYTGVGIMNFVYSINWSELRPILYSDARAIVEVEGKKVNFVNLIEDRQFYSYFLKTGFPMLNIPQKIK
jgi:hypothetical protein